MAATVNNNRNIASANPQTSNKNFRISGPISNHPTGGHAGNITVNQQLKQIVPNLKLQGRHRASSANPTNHKSASILNNPEKINSKNVLITEASSSERRQNTISTAGPYSSSRQGLGPGTAIQTNSSHHTYKQILNINIKKVYYFFSQTENIQEFLRQSYLTCRLTDGSDWNKLIAEGSSKNFYQFKRNEK